jgi:hypothetical protein
MTEKSMSAATLGTNRQLYVAEARFNVLSEIRPLPTQRLARWVISQILTQNCGSAVVSLALRLPERTQGSILTSRLMKDYSVSKIFPVMSA